MMDTFNNHLHLPVTKIDDSARMLSRLKVRPSVVGNQAMHLVGPCIQAAPIRSRQHHIQHACCGLAAAHLLPFLTLEKL